MGVGVNLKRIRGKTKYSQRDIADLLGVDKNTYANWENEVTDVKSEFIPKLATIFDVEIKDLFASYLEQPQQPEPEAIYLSDTTATEKIIYLQKLGVIDFLRDKNNVSINGLATVLSATTGAKIETLQPMLNPIISQNAGQKNNPLNSKNTVSKVEKQLINIGFNLNETI